MGGVDVAAGNALLSSISAVGDSYAAVQTGQAEAAAASRAAKLEVMAPCPCNISIFLASNLTPDKSFKKICRLR